jgi:hypothetical protein
MNRKESESTRKSSWAPLPKQLQRVLRLMIVAGWVIPTVLFSILVLFAPPDILDRWPAVAALCSKVNTFMSQLLSGIDIFRHARSTLFPQVAIAATTYAVIWWCVMTGTSVVLTAIGFRGASETLAMDHSRRKLLVVTLISPLMAPLCLFAFFCLPGDPTFAKGLTATSRIGYAWMGSLAILFSSFLTCAWPVCVRALIFYNSLRRNHHV